MLQRTITKSQESFSSLNLQLNDLSMELKKAGSLKPQVQQMMFTAQEFVKNHEESLLMIRAVSKKLFDLAEQLATKEIESDPKGFIIRENINRMTMKKEARGDFN